VTYVIVREQDSPREQLSAAAPSLQPAFTRGSVSVYARLKDRQGVTKLLKKLFLRATWAPWLILLLLSGCARLPQVVATPSSPPASVIASALPNERRELRFQANDGIILAGELDLPTNQPPRALVVIVHHAGPVDRESYAYLAELLLPAGFAVFRFDKRGNGASAGEYGCCEATDALAAYQAAISQPEVVQLPVFIVAQSIGTRYVAEQFAEFHAIHPPSAVALLSSLLGPEEIVAVSAPVQVIVAASEPDLERIGPQAVARHQAVWPYGAELYIAAGAEHTLFDITDGPIDWDDPAWAERYHRGAMERLIDWLDTRIADLTRGGADVRSAFFAASHPSTDLSGQPGLAWTRLLRRQEPG
jgi:uncharacterized protein